MSLDSHRSGQERIAVFLDRDGVLNRSIVRDGRPFAPTSLDQFEILPDAAASVRLLKDAGFLTIVATNQKDVGVGKLDPEVLDAMHGRLRAAMPLDDIYVCTCVDECPCYKPNPGMLLAAARDHDVNLAGSVMVGDRWRDVEAGKRAGCGTVFIDYGYAEELTVKPDHIVTSVSEAAAWILAQRGCGSAKD